MAEPVIYQLKATLMESEPSIWRRIHVHDNIRLPKLHRVLQIVMNWEDSHLHEFRFGKLVYAVPDPEDQQFGRVVRDSRKIALNTKLKRPGDQCVYHYDFGDGWRIELMLEAISLRVPGGNYPCCTDGAMNAPPEDSGGPGGYRDYVEALASKKHPRHEEMLEWRGRFDPLAFLPEQINATMRAEFLPRVPKPRQRRETVVTPIRVPLRQTVFVTLTSRDCQLILDHTFAEDELTLRLQKTKETGTSTYEYSLDELEELIGFVAAEANHAKVKKLQKELYALYDKLENAQAGIVEE
jgi:hypothetical protein